MKIDFATRDVQMTPAPVSETFKIAMNSKMFEVLYSSLYKRPKDAIMRELVSNIYDAHLLNGQTRPGKIILPSVLEAVLTFRDYGPGLNDTFIREMYTTLGASTKEDDETAIGNYGLGSKTPMAYTDAFTVVSRHKGEMRIYTVVKGPDLIPVLRSDGQVYESDEPDGMEIKIPCKPGDEYEWSLVAQRVLRWFDPNLVEVLNLQYGMTVDRPEFVFENDRWAIMKDTNFKSAALMGPVTYELDWTALGEGPETRVLFKMPMGAVQPQPSREGLTYDPRTSRMMASALAEFNVEFREYIEAQLQGLGAYDAAVAFRKLKAAWPKMPMPVDRETTITTQGEIHYVNAKQARRANKYGSRPLKFEPSIKAPGFAFTPGDTTVVILNDLEDPREVKLRKRLKENADVFPSTTKEILVVNNLADIGNPAVYKLLSCLFVEPNKSRAKGRKDKAEAPIIYTVDPSAPYLEDERHYTIRDSALYTPLTLKSFDDANWGDKTRFAQIDGQRVWGLTKRARHYYRDLELIDLDTWIKLRCKEMASDRLLLECVARRKQTVPVRLRNWLKAVEDPTTLPPAARRLREEMSVPTDHPDLQLYHQALTLGFMVEPKLPRVFDFAKAIADFEKRHPLFHEIMRLTDYPPTDTDQLRLLLSSLKVRACSTTS